MLVILEDKFGTKLLVIQDIVSQLEKMKVVNSDGMLVEFVECLEKIKRDLTHIDQLSQMANATNISKIEAKLPARICEDWVKQVCRENLYEANLEAQYEALMVFLTAQKKVVKRNMSIDRGNLITKSMVNYTTGSVSSPSPLAASSGTET